MSAFRDPDPTTLAAFATHVSIAETLLDAVADFQARLCVDMNAELRSQQRESWRDLWSQLDQARGIAAMLGRDLGAFDAARTRVGGIHLVVSGKRPLLSSMFDNTAAAIDSLRAAVPEVVIPLSRDSEYRNPVRYIPHRSFKNPAFRLRLWIQLLIIVGLAVSFRCGV